MTVPWSCEPPVLARIDGPVLAYGMGRSYGDSCLNEGGVLLDTRGMDRLLAFDPGTGRLLCEAGLTLDRLLAWAVPRGWFLPVTPGTKYVTIGGAIANDVHGKNHHRAGTFGRHVLRLELLRSSGERITCSPAEHPALFGATIGGLGLTGLILTAELQLRRIVTSDLVVEKIPYGTLEEFFRLTEESDATHEYTVAWIDAFASGRQTGRGIFMRGDHADAGALRADGTGRRLVVPVDAPGVLLSPVTIRAFNALYYRLAAGRRPRRVHYDPFFYPLDAIGQWNRLYGRRGFMQYQCVVPVATAPDVVRTLLERIARSRRGSFLAVLKRFGAMPSPGILSFPRPGFTLALDFAFDGRPVLELFAALDRIVMDAGGARYPAKDACMSPEMFTASFPRHREFEQFLDPKFSSSFWRRVHGTD